MKELEGLQRRLTEMLLAFRQFTDAHGLTFFLVGGSALGACRHHGFIPWDDDVDIAMILKKWNRSWKQKNDASENFCILR